MDVKDQFKNYTESIKDPSGEFRKCMATFFLGLPVPMSYEVWSYLHSILEEEEEKE